MPNCRQHAGSIFSKYSFPTLIDFGVGARRNITGELSARNLSKPLIVTDEGLAKLSPVTGVKVLLEDGGHKVEVFSGIVGNPVKSQVIAGVKVYKEVGADSIVAIGGGASVDVAKAIAFVTGICH